jgi:hypothetical protein
MVRDPRPLRLTTLGSRPNVFLDIEGLTSPLWQQVPAVLLDLLDLAAFVYSADQVVARGDPRDADLGAKWRRRLFFRVALREPDRWQPEPVQRALADALSFLSDDEYYFQFVSPRHEQPPAPKLVFDGDPFNGEVSAVIPFSGGLDSLAGAVRLAVSGRKRVLLVHHDSNQKLAPRYGRLLYGLSHLAQRSSAAHPC